MCSSLTAVLQKLVSSIPDGFVRALAEINEDRSHHMSPQILHNKLNPNYDEDYLNVKQADKIIRRLDLPLPLAKHFAGMANAVVVVLPSVPESDMALLDSFMGMTKELGEASSEFQKSYADGEIDQKEYKRIELQVDEIIAACTAFKAVVKRVVK